MVVLISDISRLCDILDVQLRLCGIVEDVLRGISCCHFAAIDHFERKRSQIVTQGYGIFFPLNPRLIVDERVVFDV